MTRFWTDEEMGVAADTNLTHAEVAEFVGRSTQSVKHMRRKMSSGWAPERMPWTDTDDDFIRQSPHLTAAQLAKHLGRTAGAIALRRFKLGIHVGPGNWTKGNPNAVGRRRILARTCTDCGLFLDAEFFRLTRTGWLWQCVRCSPARIDADVRRERVRRSKSKHGERGGGWRLQQLTLRHANRHGQPYTEKDYSVLSDSDLTIFEKAIQLGRTYKATSTQIAKCGYSSKIGKGDPVDGQWLIEFPERTAA